MNLYTNNNQFIRTNGGLWKVHQDTPPSVLPNDMDFVYQANDFDGTKIANKAPNSTFGDYLAYGTITKNGSGSTCYLSNDWQNQSGYGNYLYKELTNSELTNIMAENSTYTFFIRVLNNDFTHWNVGGIMSCRRNGGYIYMIRSNGDYLQIHTGGGNDIMDSNFTLDVDRVLKVVISSDNYIVKNLDNGIEWNMEDSSTKEMGTTMTTFNAGYDGENGLDRFYCFAGIARATTSEEDAVIKNILMNQSA